MRYQRPFVPEDFEVPAVFETDRVRLRQLTVADVDLDFDAVTSSENHLSGTFGTGDWPAGLTLARNLADLGWHETEFDKRASFAYTVVSLDESTCLGCVYLYPSLAAGFDALCFLWVRESALADGLDDHLFEAVKGWLADAWPFESVAFPGRLHGFDAARPAIDRAGFARWLAAYKAAWESRGSGVPFVELCNSAFDPETPPAYHAVCSAK